MAEPLIEFKSVSKSFGDKVVLKNIDLTINEGQVTTIIGKSGVGKSVLIKHVVGLLTADSGEILIRGEKLSEMTRKQKKAFKKDVSYMFQNNALFDSLTVFENIALPLKEKTSMNASAIRSKVEELMEQLEIEGIGSKYPSQLSGGMQKRVALARAVATDPKIVLFDEPTTGLDPIRKNAVLSMIARYQERFGFTAVLVSHDIPDVFYISNRVAILDGASIIFQGAPAALEQFRHPVVHEYVHSVENLKEELTGLVTRQNFERDFRDEKGLFKPSGTFAAIMFSVERFEQIQEQVGELASQRIIQSLAQLVDKHIGPVGVSTRYSLEDILSLLPRTSLEEAERIRDRLADELARQEVMQDESYPEACVEFSVRAGLAEGNSGQDLVALAAKAKSGQKVLAKLSCAK